MHLTAPLWAAGPDQTWDSQISPGATYPYEGATGKIYLQNTHAPEGSHLPIRRCILVHGYGITQNFLDFYMEKQGTGARLVRVFVESRGQTALRAFAESYSGGPFLIDRLRKHVCEEVVMTLQESTQTSVTEMATRTEALLAGLCGDKLTTSFRGQKRCAIYGHSKGGTAVALIARKCGDRTAKSEIACRNFDEIYTSSSTEGGIGISALILGAKREKEREVAHTFLRQLHLMMRVAPEWKAEGNGDDEWSNNDIDVFSDHKPGITNPAWYDFSPLAASDRFAAGIRHDGWFRGQYAALGSSHDFSHDGVPGVGTKGKPDTEALEKLRDTAERSDLPAIRAIGGLAEMAKLAKERPSFASIFIDDTAKRFSDASRVLHYDENRHLFDEGRRALADLATNEILRNTVNAMTWEKFQSSDGLVEGETALTTCRQYHAGKPDVKERCRLLSGAAAINHYAIAGYASEAVDHLILEWSR